MRLNKNCEQILLATAIRILNQWLTVNIKIKIRVKPTNGFRVIIEQHSVLTTAITVPNQWLAIKIRIKVRVKLIKDLEL